MLERILIPPKEKNKEKRTKTVFHNVGTAFEDSLSSPYPRPSQSTWTVPTPKKQLGKEVILTAVPGFNVVLL